LGKRQRIPALRGFRDRAGDDGPEDAAATIRQPFAKRSRDASDVNRREFHHCGIA
jgi:hypothetical protein